jgi:hypothetical protein
MKEFGSAVFRPSSRRALKGFLGSCMTGFYARASLIGKCTSGETAIEQHQLTVTKLRVAQKRWTGFDK